MELEFSGVPVLETERLILREFRAADFVDFADMWADPVVVKHISGVAATRSESWARLKMLAGSWPLTGWGGWAVQDKANGRFVGNVGFSDFKRIIEPDLGRQPEAAWVLAQWAHGKGYATEAMLAAMAWGKEQFGGVKPVCIIDPDYIATKRVAEKCGFVDKVLTTYKGEPTLIMEYRG